jgi:hypothetical protein
MERLVREAAVVRIFGPNAPGAVTTSATQRRGRTATGFSVAEEAKPQSAAPATSLRAIGGIDALIALQSEDEPGARRRRAVKHGRAALDALDELKHALLAGTLDAATVRRLKAATADLNKFSGDAGLDAVLAEIEVRLEVEIAKLSPRSER